MKKQSPRWKERMQAFQNALARLSEVIALSKERELSEFENDSLIKRFEFTYEMAWKLMMSYEKENGVEQILGSRDVVRHAYSLTLIDNGEAWMDMIDARNQSAHIYDEDAVVDIKDGIIHTFFPLLLELQKRMQQICTD